jgi:hypothetical protein
MGSIVLLAVGVNLAGAQKAPKDQPAAKIEPAPKAGAAKASPKAGTPKGGTPKAAALPKGAARVVDPRNVVTRLFRMTPEQREHALEQLPPDRQEAYRAQLKSFDELPKDQQEMQIQRLERFEALSPEKRAEFRQLMMALKQLPGPRQNAVGRELYLLQQMPERQRENTLNRPQFQQRFSPEELRILNGLSAAWSPPQ